MVLSLKNSTQNKKVVAQANAKIILLGEHAVVYNYPAIALALKESKVFTEIKKRKDDTYIYSSVYQGKLKNANNQIKGLQTIIIKVLARLNKSSEKLNIKITSNIPQGRGMGSSAAVSASVVKALYKYFDAKLSKEKLSEWVNLSESIVHKKYSGIDTAITVYKKPIYFSDKKQIKEIKINLNAYLLVSDSGIAASTKKAVLKVAKLKEDDPKTFKQAVKSIGSLVNEALIKIKENDIIALGKILNLNQKQLEILTVSNQNLDDLIKIAKENNALGAKLSGGGLGGCVISLCKSKKDAEMIAKKQLEYGIKDYWIMDLNAKDDNY